MTYLRGKASTSQYAASISVRVISISPPSFLSLPVSIPPSYSTHSEMGMTQIDIFVVIDTMILAPNLADSTADH